MCKKNRIWNYMRKKEEERGVDRWLRGGSRNKRREDESALRGLEMRGNRGGVRGFDVVVVVSCEIEFL